MGHSHGSSSINGGWIHGTKHTSKHQQTMLPLANMLGIIYCPEIEAGKAHDPSMGEDFPMNLGVTFFTPTFFQDK